MQIFGLTPKSARNVFAYKIFLQLFKNVMKPSCKAPLGIWNIQDRGQDGGCQMQIFGKSPKTVSIKSACIKIVYNMSLLKSFMKPSWHLLETVKYSRWRTRWLFFKCRFLALTSKTIRKKYLRIKTFYNVFIQNT